jgi:hypothetical protein
VLHALENQIVRVIRPYEFVFPRSQPGLYFDGEDFVFGTTGALYGTTSWGGGYRTGCNNGCGTVFQLIAHNGMLARE